jgi:DNA-binding NarL/FixJ family response regulator
MGKTIVTCDDHTLFLSGLTQVINTSGRGYDIIAFSDPENCIHYLKNNPPVHGQLKMEKRG